MRLLTLVLPLAALLSLAGCDLVGGESASTLAARREAEAKAIGAGCRHAARSVEQCFALNRRADKAALFVGWREMNDYMRENKMETMPPEPATELAAAAAAAAADGAEVKPAAAVAAKR